MADVVENITKQTEEKDTFYYTMTGLCKKQRRYSEEEKKGEEGEQKQVPDNMNFNRAVIMKDTIRQVLYYREQDKKSNVKKEDRADYPKNVLRYMSTRYDAAGIDNFQQRRIILLDDFQKVMRYIRCETRTPMYFSNKETSFGREKPDFAFVSGDRIELGFWKIGKADFTRTGKKNALVRDFSLFSLVKYARELGFKYITASYYYLRKTYDSSDWSQNDPVFFGRGDNVISMTDIWEGVPNELDFQMEEELKILKDGVDEKDMPEDNCENCRYYNICKYTAPPLHLEANASSSQAKSKVAASPSTEQQAVIDF